MIVLLLSNCREQEKIINIGILHSLSGTMAISEQGVANTVLLAIDEINQNGGLLGNKINPILVDGKSDINTFIAGAKKLIKEDKVKALFACWTSHCRKAITPIVEENNNLLFYPVQFEGLESSEHVIYTGASPNQQIIPGTTWALKNLGKKIYLVGSDYIYPRTANRIIRSVTHLRYPKDSKIVGEKYVPLGGTNIETIISEIKQRQPDVIINTINGDSNIAFFEQLKKADLSHIPVMSFSLSENEITKIGKENLIGHYATWNYFQHLNNKTNNQFKERYKKMFGDEAAIGDAMVSAYISVKLWAQTVQYTNSFEPEYVKKSMGHQSFNSPGGIVSVDNNSGYLWKSVYIGQIQSNGLFKTLNTSDTIVAPTPFPIFHSQHDWKMIQNRISKSL